MKQTLNEELSRIHSLLYENEIIDEQGFLKKIADKFKIKKIDDPKKADLISSNVGDVYQTLQKAADSGGIGRQKLKDMFYQKAVEALQIALVALGYKLPVYGIDGLFGSETSKALSKFVNDYIGNKEKIQVADGNIISKILEKLEDSPIDSEKLKSYVDPVVVEGDEELTELNISSNDGFQKYAEIAQSFIDSRPPNPLGITGEMIANGAKQAYLRFNRYIPPELALSQLAQEGGIGDSEYNRPVRTRNPFNVGNVDRTPENKGKNINKYFGDVQSGINSYFTLIAVNYLGNRVHPSYLFKNFVNLSGKRYAKDTSYEQKISSIAKEVNNISKSILATP